MAEKRLSQSISFIAHNSAITGITMSTTLVFAFSTLYMREFIHASNFEVGLAIGLSHIISVIFSPVAGAISDSLKTPWGRRRPFLIVGALMSAVFLAFLPSTTNYLVYLTLLSFFFLFSISYQVPFYALIPEVAPEGQRGHYTIYTGLLRLAGFGLVMGFGGWFWRKNPGLPFYLTACFVLITALVTALTVQEEMQEEATSLFAGLHVMTRIKIYLRDLIAQKRILLFFSGQFFWWMGLGAFLPFATIMLKEFYHIEISQLLKFSPIVLIAGSIFVLSVIGAGVLGDRYGHSRVITIGLIVLTIAGIVAYFARSVSAVYTAAAIMMIGASPLLNEPFALLAELIPKGREGEFYGLDTISITLSQIPAAIIAGIVIDRYGYPSIFVLLAASTAFSIVFMVLKSRVR